MLGLFFDDWLELLLLMISKAGKVCLEGDTWQGRGADGVEALRYISLWRQMKGVLELKMVGILMEGTLGGVISKVVGKGFSHSAVIVHMKVLIW